MRLSLAWKRLALENHFNMDSSTTISEKCMPIEQRLGKIFGLFAGLAILIACLGLFALTSFTAEQRTRKVIRKVLGASVPSIVLLLSREFGKLILIAFLLAAPRHGMALIGG